MLDSYFIFRGSMHINLLSRWAGTNVNRSPHISQSDYNYHFRMPVIIAELTSSRATRSNHYWHWLESGILSFLSPISSGWRFPPSAWDQTHVGKQVGGRKFKLPQLCNSEVCYFTWVGKQTSHGFCCAKGVCLDKVDSQPSRSLEKMVLNGSRQLELNFATTIYDQLV